MSLPQSINPSTPQGTDAPSTLDNQIRELKQLLADILGLPVSPQTIASAVIEVNPDGSLLYPGLVRLGTLTTQEAVLDGSAIWNNGSQVFTAILLNITDTSSNPTSKLLDLQVAGVSRLSVLKAGTLLSALGSIVSQAAMLDGSVTWNAGGVVFTALKANVTDTASDPTSKLIDLQVGGVTKFSVDKSGGVFVSGGIGPVMDKVTADTTVTNTTTETSVYSKTIPAGTLSTNNRLRLVIEGRCSAKASSSGQITIKAKYDTTSISIINGLALNDGVSGAPVRIEVLLSAKGTTSSQLLSGEAHTDSVSGGRLLSSTFTLLKNRSIGTIDSTADKTLSVTVQFSVADTNNTFVMESAFLEKLA